MWWLFWPTTPLKPKVEIPKPQTRSWDTIIDMRKIFDQQSLEPHAAVCVESKDAR